MFVIVMQGQMGQYYLNARKAWVFDLDMAETFPNKAEADAAFAAAAKRGKRAHFAAASVATIH